MVVDRGHRQATWSTTAKWRASDQIEVKELMALKSSAKVAGQIYYGQLSVEAGAQPVGTFHMGPREAKAPMMGKPGAVNTLKGAEVVTDMPKQVAKPVAKPLAQTKL